VTAMAVELAWRTDPIDETIRPDDAAAIRRCILDYFEGWFEGDVERMGRALDPALAKHALGQDRDQTDVLDQTTRDEMIEGTARGAGRMRDVPDRAIRIDIAGVFGNMASVVVHSTVYVEYALLLRTRDGWRITGTVWHWAAGHGPRA